MNQQVRARPLFRFRNSLIIPVIGVLGVVLLAPREARARSGNQILETIGVSIAVGTVLGASTLPFYDQPGNHLANLGYGAAAGAVVGLGVLAYGWIAGSSDEEYSLNDRGDAGVTANQSPNRLNRIQTENARSWSGGALSAVRPFSVPSARIWMPLVSLTW